MILDRMKFLILAAALSAFSAHGAAAAPVKDAQIIHKTEATLIQKAEATLASPAAEARHDCQRHWRGHPHWRHRYWHRHRWYRHRRFRRGRWVYW